MRKLSVKAYSAEIFSNQDSGVLRIQWSANIGFGQLDIIVYPDGSVELESEALSKESIKKILSSMVDNALLVDISIGE